jgi:hypothetical protein
MKGPAILALVCSAVVALAPFADATAPRIWLASKDPVTVRGTGFHARERLALSVVAPGVERQRTLRASPAGTVTARFPDTSIEATCGRIVVRATGARGAAVVWKNVGPCGIDR